MIPMAMRPMSITNRLGRPFPYEFRNRMPTTAPSPAGPMMKKKSSAVRSSTSVAKPGPIAPSTPMRLAAMPR